MSNQKHYWLFCKYCQTQLCKQSPTEKSQNQQMIRKSFLVTFNSNCFQNQYVWTFNIANIAKHLTLLGGKIWRMLSTLKISVIAKKRSINRKKDCLSLTSFPLSGNILFQNISLWAFQSMRAKTICWLVVFLDSFSMKKGTRNYIFAMRINAKSKMSTFSGIFFYSPLVFFRLNFCFSCFIFQLASTALKTKTTLRECQKGLRKNELDQEIYLFSNIVGLNLVSTSELDNPIFIHQPSQCSTWIELNLPLGKLEKRNVMIVDNKTQAIKNPMQTEI